MNAPRPTTTARTAPTSLFVLAVWLVGSLAPAGAVRAEPTPGEPTPGEEIRVELTTPTAPVELAAGIQWGSIRVRGDAAARAVTVVARPDRPEELAGAQITVAEAGNRVTVEQIDLKPGVFRGVNLEITVPERADLELRVRRGGDVWVRGVRGLIEVTNLNGSVELAEISGAAAVNASNGTIQARFAAVDPNRDMIFTSLNGSVELCLPPSYSGRVHLETAGDPIRSDFPIERERGARTVAAGGTLAPERFEVEGRIGASDARLRASTLNGEIYLERCE